MDTKVRQAICNLFLQNMTPGDAVRDILNRFIQGEVTASSIASTLSENQGLQAMFEQYIHVRLGNHPLFIDEFKLAERLRIEEDPKNQKYPDEIPDIDVDAAIDMRQQIGFFGVVPTRGVLPRLRLARIFPGQSLEEISKESGFFEYADKCEIFANGAKLGNVDAAYCAGLFIDWLAKTAESAGHSREAQDFLKEFWPHAIRVAFTATLIGQHAKKFGLHRYTFAAGLLHESGGIFNSFRYKKDWMNYYASARPKTLHRLVARGLEEIETFEFTSAEFTALLFRFFDLFRPIEAAVCRYREPYLLKKQSGELYRLAGILLLAKLVVNIGKDPEDAQFQALRQEPWFVDLGITRDQLAEIGKRYSRQSF